MLWVELAQVKYRKLYYILVPIQKLKIVMWPKLSYLLIVRWIFTWSGSLHWYWHSAYFLRNLCYFILSMLLQSYVKTENTLPVKVTHESFHQLNKPCSCCNLLERQERGVYFYCVYWRWQNSFKKTWKWNSCANSD